VNDYLHKTSRFIGNYCIEHQIGVIVVGRHSGWKNGINLRLATNQSFVQITFNRLIQQIQYKAEEVGIKTIVSEESYTSKIDHLADEAMCHHENYLGKRVKRGLFQSSVGRFLNAGINGYLGSRRILPSCSPYLSPKLEVLIMRLLSLISIILTLFINTTPAHAITGAIIFDPSQVISSNGTPELTDSTRTQYKLEGPRFMLDATGLDGYAVVRKGLPSGYAIFHVHDVAAERNRLRGLGVKFLGGTATSVKQQGPDQYVIGKDPSGNVFVLLQQNFESEAGVAPAAPNGFSGYGIYGDAAASVAYAWL
jgi:IS605 OrfB family transposase